jgi:hypothetical protein
MTSEGSKGEKIFHILLNKILFQFECVGWKELEKFDVLMFFPINIAFLALFANLGAKFCADERFKHRNKS